MAIQFACDACGTSYEKGDEFAGKTVRCRCGAAVQVPMHATLDFNDLQTAASTPATPAAPVNVVPQHPAPSNVPPASPTPGTFPHPSQPTQNFAQAGPGQGYGQQQWQGMPSGQQEPPKSRMSADTLRLLVLCAVGVLVVGGVAAYTLWPEAKPEVKVLEPGALFVLWIDPESVDLSYTEKAELQPLADAFGTQAQLAFRLEYANSPIPQEEWHLKAFTPEGHQLLKNAHQDFSGRLEGKLTNLQVEKINAAWQKFKSGTPDAWLEGRVDGRMGFSVGAQNFLPQ